MSQTQNFEDSEIDLGELFAILLSHKLLIALFTGLSIFLSGHYNLTAKKNFTANAIFQIEEVNSSSGFTLSRELGALASIAGFNAAGGSSKNSEILLERVVGREFIIKMNNSSSLHLDPYFNNYDPNYKDTYWKAIIKKFIGWQKTEQEKKAIVERNVIKNYRKNIKFKETKSGSLSISVTHVNPKKASEYANSFMEEIGRLVENESIAAQGLRLSYLSSTLADALQDMEKAQENLKNYALKNSALAQENFISDSLQLDEFRMEKRKVTDFVNLLSILATFIQSKDLNSSSHEALRSSYPLVDDIEFRRILGMSETISAWSWPKLDTVEAVTETLRDRIKRLDVEITNIEENAKIYATSAENLAKLGREAKIAEATYTVLIEQIKSQTLAAGFQPETFKVFEYATPPLEPSSPQRLIVLLLGTLLGIFVGVSLAFIDAKRRGVYYKRSALVSNASAELNLKSKSIRRFSGKSISDTISSLSKQRTIELDEASLKLANKKIVYVLNSGGQPSASNAARILASHSSQSGKRVVLCDTTGKSNKEIKEKSREKSPDLPIANLDNNISIIDGADGAFFFTSVNFNSEIKGLTDQFDQVFVCSSNKNARLALTALADFIPGLVVISGLRKTKKMDIQNIKKIQPIDLLFHD